NKPEKDKTKAKKEKRKRQKSPQRELDSDSELKLDPDPERGLLPALRVVPAPLLGPALPLVLKPPFLLLGNHPAERGAQSFGISKIDIVSDWGVDMVGLSSYCSNVVLCPIHR